MGLLGVWIVREYCQITWITKPVLSANTIRNSTNEHWHCREQTSVQHVQRFATLQHGMALFVNYTKRGGRPTCWQFFKINFANKKSWMTSIFLPIKTIVFLVYSKPRCPSQTMGTPFWCRDFYPHVTCSARRSVHVHVNLKFCGTWLDWSQVLSRSMRLLYIYQSFIKVNIPVPSIPWEWSLLGKFSVPKPEFWINGIWGCNQHHLGWPSSGECGIIWSF